MKLKAKWYLSDYKDGLHVQCIAAFFFMYFACLTPIVTFGGLLGAATDNYIVRPARGVVGGAPRGSDAAVNTSERDRCATLNVPGIS